VGWFPYLLAGISFIPLLGVPFGIVVIVWGFVARRRGGARLVLLGAIGICITLVVYGALFYFGFYQRGGKVDELRAKLAQTMLTQAVREIEYYKIQNGRYPASLDEIVAPPDRPRFATLYDPMVGIEPGRKPTFFYYELQPDGAHYYLLSVGPDAKAFTADDILPDISEAERSRIGLVVRR
jgi:hypothetical protein